MTDMNKLSAISPRWSFKGFNILTMISQNKRFIKGALTVGVFMFCVAKMFYSQDVYTPETVIAVPLAISGAFWTALNTFDFFQGEQVKN